MVLYKTNGTRWKCTFDDEFNGTSLDAAKWTPVSSSQSGVAYGGACFTNWPGNISVASGYLRLTARKEVKVFSCATARGVMSTRYSTGQVATINRFAQTYGMFAVRAKFPQAIISGLQSSLWMWPQNLATTKLHGEIDIVENFSQNPSNVVPYIHYTYSRATVNLQASVNVPTRVCQIAHTNVFHTYAAQWSHSRITIYVDGLVCLVDNLQPAGTSPFDQPFFVALSQALGSSPNAFLPSATPLPATTQVDWVRVWK